MSQEIGKKGAHHSGYQTAGYCGLQNGRVVAAASSACSACRRGRLGYRLRGSGSRLGRGAGDGRLPGERDSVVLCTNDISGLLRESVCRSL